MAIHAHASPVSLQQAPVSALLLPFPFPIAELRTSQAAIRLTLWGYIQTARTSVNRGGGTHHLFLGSAGQCRRLPLLAFTFFRLTRDRKREDTSCTTAPDWGTGCHAEAGVRPDLPTIFGVPPVFARIVLAGNKFGRAMVSSINWDFGRTLPGCNSGFAVGVFPILTPLVREGMNLLLRSAV